MTRDADRRTDQFTPSEIEAFVEAWQSSESVSQVVKKTGLHQESIRNLACRLRDEGRTLRPMRRGRPPRAAKPAEAPVPAQPPPLEPWQERRDEAPPPAEYEVDDMAGVEEEEAPAGGVQLTAYMRKKWQRFFKELRKNCWSERRAAKATRVDPATLRRWKNDPRFAKRLRRAMKEKLDELEYAGTAIALGEHPTSTRPDGAMIRHIQGAQDPRYRKVVKHKHSGMIGHFAAQLTPQEKREHLERLLGMRGLTPTFAGWDAKAIEVDAEDT